MRRKFLSLFTFLLHNLLLIENASALSASENIRTNEVSFSSNNPAAYFDSFLRSISSADGLEASDKISIFTQRHFTPKIIYYKN